MSTFATQYAPVIWVTLLYILLYYVFLLNILRVKLKLLKKNKAQGTHFDRYGAPDPEMLAADRIQLNTLEHMPPFLILLWLQAFCASVQSASICGGIYLVLRMLYPFFLGSKLKKNIPKRLLFNTFSGYAVMVVMSGFIIASLL